MCLLTIFSPSSCLASEIFTKQAKKKSDEKKFSSSSTLNCLRFEIELLRVENRCLGAIAKGDFRIFFIYSHARWKHGSIAIDGRLSFQILDENLWPNLKIRFPRWTLIKLPLNLKSFHVKTQSGPNPRTVPKRRKKIVCDVTFENN